MDEAKSSPAGGVLSLSAVEEKQAPATFRLLCAVDEQKSTKARDHTFVMVTDSGRMIASLPRMQGEAEEKDDNHKNGTVIVAVDGTGSMHSNMTFVKQMLQQMIPGIWQQGLEVVLVNWAARKIADWEVPYMEAETVEEQKQLLSKWLDEPLKTVEIFPGITQVVTRLSVGGQTDIWGSLLQIFNKVDQLRANRGADYNVSVMMLTDGQHNCLAVPTWIKQPTQQQYALGSYIWSQTGWQPNGEENPQEMAKGLADNTPGNVPVTFVGIADAKTQEIGKISEIVGGRVTMVSDLKQLAGVFDTDFEGETKMHIIHKPSGKKFSFVREEEENRECQAYGKFQGAFPGSGTFGLHLSGSSKPVQLTEVDISGFEFPPTVAVVLDRLHRLENQLEGLVATKPPFDVNELFRKNEETEKQIHSVLRALPRMRKFALVSLEPVLQQYRDLAGQKEVDLITVEVLAAHGHNRDNEPKEVENGNIDLFVQRNKVLQPFASKALQLFAQVGVETETDLEYITEEDILAFKDLKLIEQRKLIGAVKAWKSGKGSAEEAKQEEPTRQQSEAGRDGRKPLVSADSVLLLIGQVFRSYEIWVYDLLNRSRGLMKVLSISIENKSGNLGFSTRMTPEETQRLLGNLEAMAMPSRKAKKLLQFLETLKASTSTIVSKVMQVQTQSVVMATIQGKKFLSYKFALGDQSYFVKAQDCLHYTNSNQEDCCICLMPEKRQDFSFQCSQCNTYLHQECKIGLRNQFGSCCIVCRSGNWVPSKSKGNDYGEAIFAQGCPAVAVALGYKPDVLVHEPNHFSILKIAKDAQSQPVILEMGEVWRSMRAHGTVPSDPLCSDVFDHEDDEKDNRSEVVNGVLPLAFHPVLYQAYRNKGLLFTSAINSTGNLWALIPSHRMFSQGAVQFFLLGEQQLALQMIASYKHCYDDLSFPDPRFKKNLILQLSENEPIGEGKNHSPGLLAVEALARWVVSSGTTRVVHVQAWMTTVWFRALGQAIGNKPHPNVPANVLMDVRKCLWKLQEAMQTKLDKPSVQVKSFEHFDKAEQEVLAPLLQGFLYELFALVLQPLDSVLKTNWSKTVLLAQWFLSAHRAIDDIMKLFLTTCNPKLPPPNYKSLHIPAVREVVSESSDEKDANPDLELVELRDLPEPERSQLVIAMFKVFLGHNIAPKAPVANMKATKLKIGGKIGPQMVFSEAYDLNQSSNNPVVVILGAGDHGKSTLLGATFAHQMDPEAVKKYKQMVAEEEKNVPGSTNLAFAWLSDRSPQERYHRCTNKPHYWNFHTGHRQCALIDVPGQRKYLKSAFIGIAAADCAVLVISALPFEHEPALLKDGQAYKHLLAAAAYGGIKRFIIAVTKMDLVSFEQKAFQNTCDRVSAAMKKMGIQDIAVDGSKCVYFVPLSGLQSENIYSPSVAMPWAADEKSEAQTLIQAFDRIPISRTEQLTLPFRLMVDGVIKSTGRSCIVCGVVTYGTVAIGEKVLWGPNGEQAKVKTVEKFYQNSPKCDAGDMVGLQLMFEKTVEPKFRIKKGDVVGSVLDPPTYADSVDVQVRHIGRDTKVGFRPTLVLGTNKVESKLTAIAGEINNQGKVIGTGISQMVAGKSYLIQLSLPRAVAVENFERFKRHGRCILMAMDGSAMVLSIGVVKRCRTK